MARIRSVTATDLPDLLPLIAALASHHGDKATATLAMLERDFTGATPWLHGLMAERDLRPVAYAALCPTAQLQFGARGLDIHHLYVEPDHRGKGLGRRMIEACEQKAAILGCTYLTAGIAPGNEDARAAYLAIGFHQIGDTRFRLDLQSAMAS